MACFVTSSMVSEQCDYIFTSKTLLHHFILDGGQRLCLVIPDWKFVVKLVFFLGEGDGLVVKVPMRA